METKCYLCNSRRALLVHIISGYKLLRCCSCGLVQTILNKKDNRESINKLKYDDEYLCNYLSREKELKSYKGGNEFKKLIT